MLTGKERVENLLQYSISADKVVSEVREGTLQPVKRLLGVDLYRGRIQRLFLFCEQTNGFLHIL